VVAVGADPAAISDQEKGVLQPRQALEGGWGEPNVPLDNPGSLGRMASRVSLGREAKVVEDSSPTSGSRSTERMELPDSQVTAVVEEAAAGGVGPSPNTPGREAEAVGPGELHPPGEDREAGEPAVPSASTSWPLQLR
jgi:hypothetical protein